MRISRSEQDNPSFTELSMAGNFSVSLKPPQSIQGDIQYSRDQQLMVLQDQDPLVFHPPFTRVRCEESGPISDTIYLGEKKTGWIWICLPVPDLQYRLVAGLNSLSINWT